jgi:hypothetical protein
LVLPWQLLQLAAAGVQLLGEELLGVQLLGEELLPDARQSWQ